MSEKDRDAEGAALAVSGADVVGFHIEDDRLAGEGGFLKIRRMRLRTVRRDGSRSSIFLSDYVERPKGIDAVVLGLYHRDAAGALHVLLRKGLRPALHYGRRPELLPVPDRETYFFFTEVVAGIIESHDRGEAGIRHRAAEEAWEESGFRVDPDRVELLGAPVFPSPGMTPECFHLTCAEVNPADRHPQPPVGDGSPMEEGSSQRFVPLNLAIALCEQGEIQDAKTELLLRRLRARKE
jgi:ADP-ribose pyrophosphatase